MRLLAAAALLSSLAQACISQSCANFSPKPVPTSQLPSFFPQQNLTDPSTLSSLEQIRQTLSEYAVLVDAYAFDSLSSIFAPDAVANYSGPLGVLDGLDTIISTLSTALDAYAGTQHLLGPPRIRICDESNAVSVTLFQAIHFSSTNATIGPLGAVDYRDVFYSFAQYQDSWVKRGSGWKIRYRNVVYMGPLVRSIN